MPLQLEGGKQKKKKPSKKKCQQLRRAEALQGREAAAPKEAEEAAAAAAEGPGDWPRLHITADVRASVPALHHVSVDCIRVTSQASSIGAILRKAAQAINRDVRAVVLFREYKSFVGDLRAFQV